MQMYARLIKKCKAMLWTVCATLENCDYAFVEITEALNCSAKYKMQTLRE